MYKILTKLAISPALKGYQDIIDCVEELKKNINAKIIPVYEIVARKRDGNWHRVERNIRKAVQTSLSYGDLTLLDKIFGSVITSDARLTNSQFLKCLTIYITEVQQSG